MPGGGAVSRGGLPEPDRAKGIPPAAAHTHTTPPSSGPSSGPSLPSLGPPLPAARRPRDTRRTARGGGGSAPEVGEEPLHVERQLVREHRQHRRDHVQVRLGASPTPPPPGRHGTRARGATLPTFSV